MSPKLEAVTHELRSLGVSPAIVKMVQQDLASTDAPPITKGISSRLRDVCSKEQKAVLVLCTNGKYKVFSQDGHDVLRNSAKKHKPWALPRKADKTHH